MKKKLVIGLAAAIGATGLAHAAEVQLAGPDEGAQRRHSFYLGVGYGPVELKTSGEQREVEGIDFSFEANADDLGGMAYAGYWITEHVGVEIGGRDYGRVNVPFSFNDPHDNTSGTGESEVAIDGFNASLLLGYDLTKDIQIVGRAGMLSWSESYDSRFDIPGEPAIRATAEDSGTDPALGLGLSYRFSPGWQLEARYEFSSLGEDDVSLMTLGLSYDFTSLFDLVPF